LAWKFCVESLSLLGSIIFGRKDQQIVRGAKIMEIKLSLLFLNVGFFDKLLQFNKESLGLFNLYKTTFVIKVNILHVIRAIFPLPLVGRFDCPLIKINGG
jgi:hypothetical protein